MTRRKTLRWLQYALIAAGALTLAYCAFVYFEAGVFRAYEGRVFDRTVHDPLPAPATGNQTGPAEKGDDASQRPGGSSPFLPLRGPQAQIKAWFTSSHPPLEECAFEGGQTGGMA